MSHSVNSGQLASVLTCRQHISRFMREWEMDPHLRPYIIRSRFYGVYRIGHITLDWGLITSLVEKWRLETYTFHLPVGKMTITLQDVVVILGLRIHVLPITGTYDIDWSLLCYELLGVTPPTSEIKGSTISTRWLSPVLSSTS
ncbi:serine/threonine-protein phosphatase 7 long form homolog [Vitis vinifera]|uniref:serine/threonine-protein phosphatase 7 long form homolog n=1 Tax=Vitis vinifera TaxID=29760 RepID=UPI00053F7141|nr:serine/threonine-protein phosphatase 7 long form homolog [Vitis vinifera]|eukprot:XP_010648970.1 PREDICTED: serine/threonine-protein phosphatase 7 long form homolog [Vitis vinifera]